MKVPARAVKVTKSIPKELFDDLVNDHVRKLLANGVTTGVACMEYEILLWELTEELYSWRILPEHVRVKDCSRQISKTILNSNMSTNDKRLKIKLQQTKG